MNKPNEQFILNVKDIEMIEDGLRKELAILSRRRNEYAASDIDHTSVIDSEIRQLTSLLGRIHNQKNWFRPSERYIGG